MAKWHTSKIEGGAKKGEMFAAHPKDGPVFQWKVVTAEPSMVEWQCVKGPGQSVGTTARFRFTEANDGRTLVEFTHSGWPDARGNFRKCNTLWAILLFHLQKHLHTQGTEPAFG